VARVFAPRSPWRRQTEELVSFPVIPSLIGIGGCKIGQNIISDMCLDLQETAMMEYLPFLGAASSVQLHIRM
jgi:hypothetical protein